MIQVGSKYPCKAKAGKVLAESIALQQLQVMRR